MISAITSLLAGVELVTELLSVAVILMALDKLATAIRLTYRAGFAVGAAWHRYGVPAVLWTADHISWAWSQIDWQQVRFDVAAMLRILIAGTIAAAITAHQLLIKTSAALGRGYAAIVVKAPVGAAPAINSLALIADEIEQLPAKQVRLITGSRRKAAKRQMVAAYVAA